MALERMKESTCVGQQFTEAACWLTVHTLALQYTIDTVSDVTVFDPFNVEPVPAQYTLPYSDINYQLFKRGVRMWLVGRGKGY